MAAVHVSEGGLAVGDRSLLDRASWGALFAGFFVGMGLLFLLLSLGAAIGLTAVDPRDLGSWRSAGIGVGIWGGIAAIIASFGSAWVAARLSTSFDRAAGMLHGLALWGLTWAVLLWMGAMLVGGVIGGAARATGTAMQSAATAAGASGEKVSRDEAQRAASDVKQQVSGAVGQAQQQLDQNKEAVSEAAATGGQRGALGAFLAALFTMIASALGGAMGVPHHARRTLATGEAVPARPLEPQRT